MLLLVVFERTLKEIVISGLEVIKLEYSLRLKFKCNDWLLALADMCPQAANHCALSPRMNSSFITSRPGMKL